jgi:uncharacterized protein (TIGR02246 family)
MHRSLLLLAVVLALSPFAVVRAQAPTDACVVWAREASFAQSVADHDAAAFAAHLHPDAVFIDGSGNTTRGVDAITAGWAQLIEGKGIEGKGMVLHWYPDAVDVGANGAVALSRGPYWMENPAAPPEQRYRRGRFVSTWLRGEDGQWQVVFDGGGGNESVPATADEIANLINSRQECPAS